MISYNPIEQTILMVDDTPKNLQVLGSTLRAENYKIEFATNGKSALDWLAKKEFDLVLLDVMMPEMDGFEVCGKIRSDSKFEDMPIIFLTAKTDNESIVKGFSLGGQDFVTKPFDASELMARVQTHLDLRYSKLKLKNMNKWLEEEVEKRTLELAESNDKLQKANLELLSLDEAKNDFLHLISHEIRTPLNGIVGPLYLLKDSVESKELQELLNVLDDSVSQLEKFTSKTLMITMLKSGKYVPKINNIKFSDIISTVLIELSSKVEKKNINIETSCKPEDISMNIDSEVFLNAIKDLIENAIDYSKSKVQISCKSDSNKVTIDIVEDGGMTARAVETIFKPFAFDSGNYIKNIGINLYYSKLVIELHGGTVEIENKQAEGSHTRIVV